ncbi:MAG: single-stranded DNA-binding protein [Erysipelotrichaceae bacterium]
MNNVNLIGRITKDVELKKTKADTSMVSFTLAVKRKLANKEGEKLTDFFNCVAFGSRAVFLSEYAGKSTLIGVEGRLQSKTYLDESEKKHTTVDIVCESVQILRSPTAKNEISLTNEENTIPSEKENIDFSITDEDKEEISLSDEKDDVDRSLDQLMSEFSNYFND